MAISEQVLHPGVVETIKAPLPFGIPDTPENRVALAAALAEPAPLAPPAVMPAQILEPTPPIVAAAPTPAPTPVAAEPTPPAVIDEATPASTTTGAVVDACTTAASTTWDWAKCAGRVLNGLRTLLFFGVTGAGLLIAKLQEFDVSGYISKLTGATVAPEDLMLFLSIAGIVLRFVTTSPVFERWRKAAQGDKKEDASTGVDDGDTN